MPLKSDLPYLVCYLRPPPFSNLIKISNPLKIVKREHKIYFNLTTAVSLFHQTFPHLNLVTYNQSSRMHVLCVSIERSLARCTFCTALLTSTKLVTYINRLCLWNRNEYTVYKCMANSHSRWFDFTSVSSMRIYRMCWTIYSLEAMGFTAAHAAEVICGYRSFLYREEKLCFKVLPISYAIHMERRSFVISRHTHP